MKSMEVVAKYMAEKCTNARTAAVCGKILKSMLNDALLH